MNAASPKFYLARLISAPVYSEAGRQCGCITDFTLSLRNNWPCFDQAIIFDFNTSTSRIAHKSCFKSFSPQEFILKTPINDLPHFLPQSNQPTATQLWDKSVIDTVNIRTVQVNDLEILADESGEIWINAIDISFKGALRRLGLDKYINPFLNRI